MKKFHFCGSTLDPTTMYVYNRLIVSMLPSLLADNINNPLNVMIKSFSLLLVFSHIQKVSKVIIRCEGSEKVSRYDYFPVFNKSFVNLIILYLFPNLLNIFIDRGY